MFFPNAALNDTVSLSPLRLDVGMTYTLVITGSDQTCTLEFLHGDDTSWHTYPNLVGTPVAGVIILPFTCVGGAMRVKFAAGPTGATIVSAVTSVQSAF